MVVRTIFNALGPLTNPAGAKRQVLGVYSPHLVRPIADVLVNLGSEHVLVVHSEDGLDEISISAPTYVAELKDGSVEEYQIGPEDFGLTPSPLSELVINDSNESLAMVRRALSSEHAGASNMVCLLYTSPSPRDRG